MGCGCMFFFVIGAGDTRLGIQPCMIEVGGDVVVHEERGIVLGLLAVLRQLPDLVAQSGALFLRSITPGGSVTEPPSVSPG
jgi:hypothetical protein